MSAFTEDMLKSMAKVEATRAQRLHATIERFTAEEKDALLKEFHPDYSAKGFKVLEVDGFRVLRLSAVPLKSKLQPKEEAHE